MDYKDISKYKDDFFLYFCISQVLCIYFEIKQKCSF